MKVTYILIAVLILFPGTSFATLPSGARTLSMLPEDKVDIGRAALILAKEIFPKINIDEYSARIDIIVAEVRKLTNEREDPDYRIRVLNTYLYKTYGMHYDKNDPYVKKNINRYINGVLDNRRGSCVSMPLLYLSVAQRLGYPVYAVSAPQHIFLRYESTGLKMKNIEATNGGGYSPDDEYISVLQISKNALAHGTYLQTLTYREYLGLLIEQNGIYWGMNGNNEKNIEYLEIAIKLNPRSAASIRSLGIAYRIQSKKVAEPLSSEYMVKANSCLDKAKRLGVTSIPLTDYVETQRKAQDVYRKKP